MTDAKPSTGHAAGQATWRYTITITGRVGSSPVEVTAYPPITETHWKAATDAEAQAIADQILADYTESLAVRVERTTTL